MKHVFAAQACFARGPVAPFVSGFDCTLRIWLVMPVLGANGMFARLDRGRLVRPTRTDSPVAALAGTPSDMLIGSDVRGAST